MNYFHERFHLIRLTKFYIPQWWVSRLDKNTALRLTYQVNKRPNKGYWKVILYVDKKRVTYHFNYLIYQPNKSQCCHYIETWHCMYNTNQLVGFYIIAALALSPFMNNVEKWPNILLKSYGVPPSRFLKCVWAFFNIIRDRLLG